MDSDTPHTQSLPPISPRLCSCDVHQGKIVDRKIQEIERLIFEELKVLDSNCPGYEKDRFTVFRKGFEMLIDESASFKQLLSNINNEYVDVIAAVEKGEFQKSNMMREIKGAVSQQATLINYKKRITNLQEKIERIQSNNNDLKVDIEKLRNENKEIRNEASEKTSSEKLMKLCTSALPGLKLEEQTDIELLSTSLERLKSEVNTTQKSFDDKFREKDQKVLLQKQLSKREMIHGNLVKHNTELKKKLEKLNIAVEAAKLTGKTKGKKKDVCDVVLKALERIEQLHEDRDPLKILISSDEDDPLKKKESEQLVAYVDFFNNLFDFGQYDAAAIHAASSPKGILRTRQALQKFKEIESYDGPKSPLFLFCEALITTSTVDKSDDSLLQLTARMSMECIECALKEGNIDLALHWLNQPCVTWSVNLADFLSDSCECVGKCACGCHAVAQDIYQKFGRHKQVCLALTRQEKYQAFLEYGRTCNSFTSLDYQVVLEANPTARLAKTLLLANINDRKLNSGLSYCSIVRIFLENNELDLLVRFLNEVENNGVHDQKLLKYSSKDLIFLEKTSDKMSDKKWGEVIDLCHSSGHINLAVEILSTLVVRQAMNHAAILSSLDYIS